MTIKSEWFFCLFIFSKTVFMKGIFVCLQVFWSRTEDMHTQQDGFYKILNSQDNRKAKKDSWLMCVRARDFESHVRRSSDMWGLGFSVFKFCDWVYTIKEKCVKNSCGNYVVERNWKIRNRIWRLLSFINN